MIAPPNSTVYRAEQQHRLVLVLDRARELEASLLLQSLPWGLLTRHRSHHPTCSVVSDLLHQKPLLLAHGHVWQEAWRFG